jgi:putative MATE family efflux protein
MESTKKIQHSEKPLSLLHITWPIFIEILLFMLMGTVDTLMLSKYSDQAVAAVGVATQVMGLVTLLFGFVTAGTSILVAQYLGAKDELKAKEVFTVSIIANFCLGIVISILLYFFSSFVLKWMGLDSDLIVRGNSFLEVVGAFMFVQAIMMTISATLRSYGFTKDMMKVTILMNILNAVGNYFVIFGPFGLPVLGEFGVAWSTSIARIICTVIIIYIFMKRIGFISFTKVIQSKPVEHTRNLFKIGIPAAGENISYNASQIIITIFITMIGTEALTTKVYAQNIMMYIFLFSVAIGQGEQIIIGRLVGARELKTAYDHCIRSLKLGILISTSMAIIAAFFSKPLLSIFTNNEQIIQTGSLLLICTVLLEPGRAFNLIVISSLRAAGDVKFPVLMGILSMWGISIPIAYILGIYFELGLIGVWIGFIADEWIRGLLMLWRWRTRKWENASFVKEQPIIKQKTGSTSASH